jgi:hypothetical protein
MLQQVYAVDPDEIFVLACGHTYHVSEVYHANICDGKLNCTKCDTCLCQEDIDADLPLTDCPTCGRDRSHGSRWWHYHPNNQGGGHAASITQAVNAIRLQTLREGVCDQCGGKLFADGSCSNWGCENS